MISSGFLLTIMIISRKPRAKVTFMRKVSLAEIDRVIKKNLPAANKIVFRARRIRPIRRRSRDIEEQKVLDLLCINRWNKDLALGKVKIISKNKWYYEYD